MYKTGIALPVSLLKLMRSFTVKMRDCTLISVKAKNISDEGSVYFKLAIYTAKLWP